MASSILMSCLPILLLFSTLVSTTVATIPRKLILVQTPPLILNYHNGHLLKGNLSVNIVWYGRFTPSQKAMVTDFIRSLSPSSPARVPSPSVATWWRTTESYHGGAARLTLGRQFSDAGYSLGKSLTNENIHTLSQQGPHGNAITAVLTAADVTVPSFCSRCASHASAPIPGNKQMLQFPYLWVGNSVQQCPGQCAWPFAQPMYGPQGPPLVAPNGDVGVDGMIINLATVLAGAVTNPDGGERGREAGHSGKSRWRAAPWGRSVAGGDCEADSGEGIRRGIFPENVMRDIGEVSFQN